MLCDGCGQPKARAWDPASLGEFDFVHVATCLCCGLAIDHAAEVKDEDNREKYAYVDTGAADLGRT